MNFPGLGTAMAFTAAVAAGAAGYSPSNSFAKYLIVLSGIFAFFTLIIELLSGPYYKNKHEIATQELDLIEKLNKMLKDETIKKEGYQRLKEKIFSKF